MNRNYHGYHRPGPPLDQLVDFLWAADAYVGEAPRERVLPTGSQALIVNLGDRPVQVFTGEDAREATAVTGAVVCGARQHPLVIGTTIGATVGIHFKPGCARGFFDVPADAIAERAVSLEALWGAPARSLHDRLLATPTPRERIRVLEQLLLERARDSLEPCAALRASLDAFEEPDLASVAEVNRRTGMSPKRLLALFREHIGLSPKAFWRVRRFRAALHDLGRGALRGARLASEHGYFDQAHFLREFRALAGSNPREYLAARVAGTDHVSIYAPAHAPANAAATASAPG
jgi:AraC-like DNA-binding protein